MNFSRNHTSVFFIFISFFLFSCTSNPETVNGYLLPISKTSISDFLDRKMTENPIPGLSLALINDGKIVYRINKGFANVEDSIKVSDQTIFEGASISKPVFAYFVMTFVESGQLDLDTPLYQIYPHPDLLDDPRHQLLTARMLLTHTSGLPNWREDFEDKKLKFIQDPGTGYLYSGEGYQYLAMVLKEIEKTDWKGLEEVFQQRVAKPLSLKHTGFIQSPYMRANKAQPYDEEGELIDWRTNYWFQKEDTVFTAPASIHSEPQEFGLWIISIMDETILQKSSFDALLKPQIKIPDSPFPVDYGLGFVKLNLSFTDLYFHSGNNIGFTSSFVFDKEKKWGYVLFSNSEYGEELGLELLLFLIAGERNGNLVGGIAILIVGFIAGIIWLLVIGFRKVTSA